MGSGETLVRFETNNNNTVRVVAQIIKEGDPTTLPATVSAVALPADCHDLVRLGSSGVFEKQNFPVTDLPATEVPTDPAINTKRVFFREYDTTGTNVGDKSNGFIALPNPLTVKVEATSCLWLTYDTSNTPMPYGEKNMAPYTPFAMLVPTPATEATQVALHATGLWRHNPSVARESGPGGLTGQISGVRADYKTAAHFSDKINDLNLALNRLVALWDYGDASLVTTELDVGTDATLMIQNSSPPALVRPVRLRLGMHDGYEWSNNSGLVEVTITWS